MAVLFPFDLSHIFQYQFLQQLSSQASKNMRLVVLLILSFEKKLSMLVKYQVKLQCQIICLISESVNLSNIYQRQIFFSYQISFTLILQDIQPKHKMSKFNTPSKEVLDQQNQKGSACNFAQARTQYSQHRSGDWICFNCNNLNYSFRKKCNRCKTQTRESNLSPLSAYSYYYFVPNSKPFQDNQNGYQLTCNQPQYLKIQDQEANNTEQFPFPCLGGNQSVKSHNFSVSNTTLKQRNLERTPPKKIKAIEFNTLGTPELPSISPLIKKYKESKQKNVRTTIGDRKGKYAHQMQQFDRGSLFDAFDMQQEKMGQFGEHEACINNVFVRDFDDYSKQVEYQQNIDGGFDEIQRLISNLIIE